MDSAMTSGFGLYCRSQLLPFDLHVEKGGSHYG
jgi:hypothetical protein